MALQEQMGKEDIYLDDQVLSEEQKQDISLVSGRTHPMLGQGIAEAMDMRLSPVNLRDHPNGEIYVRYEESVRGKHVMIVQPHHSVGDRSINDSLQESYMMAQAAVHADAREVTVVAPYLAYSRSDRKARGREATGSTLVLRTFGAIGVKRMVFVDLHSPQTAEVFPGQSDHLIGQPLLRREVRQSIDENDLDTYAIVTPDMGHSKSAQYHADKLGIELLTMQKTRGREDSSKVTHAAHIPEAKDRTIYMFDDMIDTAGTAISAATALKESGAAKLYMAATHLILSDPALERLQTAMRDGVVDGLIGTDTLPTHLAEEVLGNKLKVVSVAPIIGRALIAIETNGSISEIFDDQNHY